MLSISSCLWKCLLAFPQGLNPVYTRETQGPDHCITVWPAVAHGEVATERRSWTQIFLHRDGGKPGGALSRRGDLRSGFCGLIGVCQVEKLEQSCSFWPWLQAVKSCLLLYASLAQSNAHLSRHIPNRADAHGPHSPQACLFHIAISSF